MDAWRIDSLDPLAGRAFVSWRGEDLLESDEIRDAPVFHIAAPTFAPLPVANRGVAFAAERHGFQLGLFDAEGEIAFENLGDVSEWVRRLYLGGARFRPIDGGATAVATPSGSSPPFEGAAVEIEPEAELASAHSFVTLLQEQVADFLALRQDLPRGSASRFAWRGDRSDTEADQESALSPIHDLLVRGAALTLLEILDRFPRQTESDRAERLEGWRLTAQAFADVAARLGVAHALGASPIVWSACNDFIEGTWRKEFLNEPIATHDPVLSVLHVFAAQTQGWWPVLPPSVSSASALEPTDELARLPLRLRLAQSSGLGERASLDDLLSVALASPSVLAESPDLEAVTFFAAARVVAVDGAPFVTATRVLQQSTAWDALTSGHRLNKLIRAARIWLADNLPSTVFHQALEQMIEDFGAASLLTHEPPTGSTPEGAPRRSEAHTEAATHEEVAYGAPAAAASAEAEAEAHRLWLMQQAAELRRRQAAEVHRRQHVQYRSN